MPLYKCSVINDIGEKQSMILEAGDVPALRGMIKKKQYFLLSFSVVCEKKKNEFFALSSRVKSGEVVSFYRQFSVMLKAGMSITESINTLRTQKYTVPFKNALQEVYFDIESGDLLSKAFAKHPKIFPEFFVNMVRIGEVSGTLDKVLSDMADHYESERKTKEKISASLSYPVFLLFMVAAVVFILTFFVLPRFEETLNSLGSEMPAIAKWMMSFSAFFRKYYFVIIPAIATIIFAFVCFFKTQKGRYTKDLLLMKMPVVGKIYCNLITARFSRAFVMLLGSGMNMVDCMENLKMMLGNEVFQQKFNFTVDEVKRGKRLASSLEFTRLFPLMLTEMISVGEKSGNLDEMLTSAGEYFADRAERGISSAVKMIEPIVIILIGAIVAALIFSVILPFMTLMDSI